MQADNFEPVGFAEIIEGIVTGDEDPIFFRNGLRFCEAPGMEFGESLAEGGTVGFELSTAFGVSFAEGGDDGRNGLAPKCDIEPEMGIGLAFEVGRR